MIIAIRHGHTSYNEDGKEKLRGWLPIPLSKEGMLESIRTADSLKKLNLLNGRKLMTSPLPRAIQTAQEVASASGIEIDPKDQLKDWNVGNYAGSDVNKTLDIIHSFINDPDKPIPNGEPFNSFVDRTAPFLKNLVESEEINPIVSHNRIMTLLKAMSINKGQGYDRKTMLKKGPVEPGGVMMISPDWSLQVLDGVGKSYV